MDDTQALRAAMAVARAQAGVTLTFAPGVYEFRDPAAIALMQRALSGALGANPEKRLYKPYVPYVRGLDLHGASGLTLDAVGAVVKFEGWLEPLTIKGGKDVTIKGLTIDYGRRPHSEGRVTLVRPTYFEAIIEAASPIGDGVPAPRVQFWSVERHRLIGDAYPHRVEALGGQKVRVFTDEPVMSSVRVGDVVGLMHSMHFRPAILIEESDNVRLQDVKIHAQAGMGVVGHRCSNVTFSGLNVVPAPGQYFSTSTDATHMTACTGLIRYEKSIFEGQGDDALNIHNYYWTVARSASSKNSYQIKTPVNTHASVIDYPDVGDRLEVLNGKSLDLLQTVYVTAVDPRPETMTVEIGLSEPIASPLATILLSDVSRLPKVEIVGNAFLSHRARGALIKSRNVLIENNLFMDNGGTAIHVAAEASWSEGVSSRNVVIRSNRFVGNGYSDGVMGGASAIAVNIESEASGGPLHQGLTIESNIIDGGGAERCIWVSRARDVLIRYNVMSGCKLPIVTEQSLAVKIEKNRTASEQPLHIAPVQP